MFSTVQQAAAPTTGAASQRVRDALARLDATLAQLAARSPSRQVTPATPPPPDLVSQAAYSELCRAQSAKFEADQAFREVRDHGPGRAGREAAARLAQEAARSRYATAAKAYTATPRAQLEAHIRARHNARHGTNL